MAWKEWINSQKSITFQLNQEEIENMSRSITSMKFEIVIKKNLPTKAHDQINGFTGEFYQKFREEIKHQSCSNSSRKLQREKTPKLILQDRHHSDTKTQQRCHKERKLQANITEHRCKNPQQNSSQ